MQDRGCYARHVAYYATCSFPPVSSFNFRDFPHEFFSLKISLLHFVPTTERRLKQKTTRNIA